MTSKFVLNLSSIPFSRLFLVLSIPDRFKSGKKYIYIQEVLHIKIRAKMKNQKVVLRKFTKVAQNFMGPFISAMFPEFKVVTRASGFFY